MGRTEAKLAELGLTLPQPMAPIATYVPFVDHRQSGRHLRPASGQPAGRSP